MLQRYHANNHAMPNEQLVAHIRSEFSQGTDRAAVIQSLLAVGWKVEDINAAMAAVNPAVHQAPSAPQAQMPAVPQSVYSVPQNASATAPLKGLIQNAAAGLFIACVVILTAISVLGVWDVFTGDVITKSFETLGLLAIVSIVVIAASRWIGDPMAAVAPYTPNPAFRAIRNITLITLIVSSTLLALLGVLAIWDVINDSSTVNKSLSSLAIIAFSSLIIVMVCREREQIPSKNDLSRRPIRR
jgi:hypothetical protein